jgi:hypothetical protein
VYWEHARQLVSIARTCCQLTAEDDPSLLWSSLDEQLELTRTGLWARADQGCIQHERDQSDQHVRSCWRRIIPTFRQSTVICWIQVIIQHAALNHIVRVGVCRLHSVFSVGCIAGRVRAAGPRAQQTATSSVPKGTGIGSGGCHEATRT